MPTRAQRLQTTLERAFAPVLLRVEDDSARHAGHVGARPGGETHFNVLIVSAAFAGRGRIERHRMAHDALEAEFAGGLHALTLTLRTPEEQAQKAAPV